MKRFLIVMVNFIVIIAAAASTVTAAWIPEGAPVCLARCDQKNPSIAPDGAGGAILAWSDFRGHIYHDIYAQRIDKYGNPVWTADGIPICTATDEQTAPLVVPDGDGGAIIVWTDYRTDINGDIYAQRILADGTTRWTTDGVDVCTDTGFQMDIDATADPWEGAVIVWQDNRDGNYDIYAQKIDSSGTVQWVDGLAICPAGGDQTRPQVTIAASGWAVIAWSDHRGADVDIYGQALDVSGTTRWALYGIPISTITGNQYINDIATDDDGYAVMVWKDFRSGNWDIYAHRVSIGGALQWSFGGVNVCIAVNDQLNPRIISDGMGGTIITWSDERDSFFPDIYAQRLDMFGDNLWPDDGVPVCTNTHNQLSPELVTDGDGGAIIAWKDMRANDGYYDIYARRIDKYGNVQWTGDGVAFCTLPSSEGLGGIVPSGNGDAIVAWTDERLIVKDIFAQRINGDGNWGYPNPRIISAQDVPGDQGGLVNVAWSASQFDPLGTITHYTVWRAIGAAQAMLLAGEGIQLLTGTAGIDIESDRPVIRRETLGSTDYYWYLIDSVEAYLFETYSMPVPTLFDSTAVCDDYHYFQVVAHTVNPNVYWASEPDSGYSVDNLAPCPPLCLAGEQSFVPAGLLITWDPNTEPDLDGYTVYRGLTEEFVPGPGNLLGEPCDTFTLDGGWTWDSEFYYKVAAVDIHGNESPFALLRPTDITGGETPGVPDAFFLAQNVPNPFNPTTTISFWLSEPAHVTLKIYNAAGHFIRALVDERRTANRYEVTWDGRDDAGRLAASGVYFYKLNAGAFTETKKMVLLK